MSWIWVLAVVVQGILLVLTVSWVIELKDRLDQMGPTPQTDIPVNTVLPDIQVHLMDGTTGQLLSPPGQARIVLFTMMGCQFCDALYPMLDQFSARHPYLEAVLLMMADSNATVLERTAPFLRTWRIVRVGAERRGQIPFKVAPYGIVLDKQGVVRGGATVGSVQSLDALVQNSRVRTA